MKKLLAIAVMLSSLIYIVGCGEDKDPDLVAPFVTAPSAQSVQVGTSVDLSFTFTAEAGFVSSAVTASGGTATVKTDGTAGATSGTIVVTFVAGTTEGPGSVTLTVTDKEGDSDDATVALAVIAEEVIPNEVLSGIISANMKLTSDRIYELAGRVIVKEGVTLEIEAGTIVKGREGSASLASTLVIARGAKILAEGTAEKPIIFTSILDNIQVGEKKGTNLSRTDNQKWGGLIILGKAKVSAEKGDTEALIEGLPADEAYALYGGNDDADNSGILKYVSIRHGGTLIGANNEINGLTLGGVGNGTTIDHVEIYATLDDGIELFGGSVNVSNLLVYWQGDDGVDIDQNYSGTITNFVVSHGDGVGTDEGLEIDGPENSTYTSGLFTLKDGTIINDGIAGSAADLKSKAQGTLNNIKFTGYASAKLKFRASYETDCATYKSDAFKYLVDATPKFIVTGCEFAGGVSVYTESKNASDVACAVPAADVTLAGTKAVSTTATGADMAAFSGWSLAHMNGQL